MQKYWGRFPEIPFVHHREGSEYGDEPFEFKYYCSQPEPRITFAAMMSLLDKQVGDILIKLKELGIDENRIVIFTSDNGPHKEGGADPVFFNSSGGLRSTKRDLYEGGSRVPMIAYWPETMGPGRTSDNISAFWDFLPTACEVAGIEASKNMDGISFLPELLGKEQAKHDHLYWEFTELGGKQAVRKGKWKLVKLNIFEPSKTRLELYNLENDPSEQNDMSEMHPDILVEMKAFQKNEHTYSADFPFNNFK
jgi:arylsulfatase A-like enzyme